jgi:hypothetical protein
MRLVFIFIGLMVLVGCGPVVPTDDNGAFKLPEAQIVISPDENSPRYNVLTYNQNTEPHSQIERDFRHYDKEKSAYEIFRDSRDRGNCQPNKSGPEFSVFLVSGDKVTKLKINNRFELSPQDILRVVAENGAACQTLFYQFAIVRR